MEPVMYPDCLLGMMYKCAGIDETSISLIWFTADLRMLCFNLFIQTVKRITHENPANKSSMLPALVFGSKSLLAFLTTALVSRSIYQSYLSLPPSSNTRDRQTRRNSHVKTFVLLAVTSFGLAHLFAFTYAFSSYKIWASEHGVELPTRCAHQISPANPSNFSASSAIKALFDQANTLVAFTLSDGSTTHLSSRLLSRSSSRRHATFGGASKPNLA